MASTGDIYRILAVMELPTGDVAEMVSFYEVVSGGGALTAEDVSNTYESTVLEILQDYLHQSREINRVYTINGHDNLDYHDTNPGLQGDITGSAMPSVLAMGFRGPWPGPGFNRARHRIPLGNTSIVSSVGALSTTYADTLDPVVNALGDQLVHTDGTLNPVTIAGVFKLGTDPVKRGSAVGIWEVDLQLTTQKTRQQHFWYAPDQTP